MLPARFSDKGLIKSVCAIEAGRQAYQEDFSSSSSRIKSTSQQLRPEGVVCHSLSRLSVGRGGAVGRSVPICYCCRRRPQKSRKVSSLGRSEWLDKVSERQSERARGRRDEASKAALRSWAGLGVWLGSVWVRLPGPGLILAVIVRTFRIQSVRSVRSGFNIAPRPQ